MKIIHTADWHLCDRLGRIDRTDDLRQRVERVAALCAEHAADVLLIAGDLFSEQATVEQMTDALSHIRRVFRHFFARGGTILAITGNHDRDGRINMVRAGMTLASPFAGQGGILTGGRMYLLNARALASLVGAGGQRVQFVLVPYPFASRYDLTTADYRTKEEETRCLQGKVAEWVREVSLRPEFDPALPTVLVAHLHVRGAETHTLYKLTERDDVPFDFADLNPGWAYVALGHIHKPHAVNGQANVRYPGSLDRLDFGETHEDHGVLLLEVGRTGLLREPEHLPIPATPFHTIAIDDAEAERESLKERFPHGARSLVKLTVNPPRAGTGRDEVARNLRTLFPRLQELKWSDDVRDEEETAPSAFAPRAGFAATVRDFLAERLADDPDRAAVAALADEFLRTGGEA